MQCPGPARVARHLAQADCVDRKDLQALGHPRRLRPRRLRCNNLSGFNRIILINPTRRVLFFTRGVFLFSDVLQSAPPFTGTVSIPL